LVYTRYIDKTQVFYLFDNDHITHRVLHVQLVSKIARVIGRALSLNEDLIEAISLGHDVGHVPFGHNGEKRLNKLLNNLEGTFFCHNAQSVRALQFIEDKGNGLNLTLQVLDGILCHNGEVMLDEIKPCYQKTKEDFKCEYKNCLEKENASKTIYAMTLEGCVMRISDIIAYIGRDLEDAITLNLIKRKDIPKRVEQIIENDNSSIVNTLVLDVINNSFNKDHIKLSEEKSEAIKEFYSFSNEKIYNNPLKTSQDEKINKMFDILFNTYLDDICCGKKQTSITKHFLENMNEQYIDKISNPRKVCDYIAGMTDDFFNMEFKEIVIPKSFGFRIEEN